jgi:hypothetical protein
MFFVFRHRWNLCKDTEVLNAGYGGIWLKPMASLIADRWLKPTAMKETVHCRGCLKNLLSAIATKLMDIFFLVETL